MSDNAKPFARPRRLMTGPYLAHNPIVVGAMATADLVGMLAPRRAAPLPADRPLNILVANLAHLGDLIIMLPLLARLRASQRTAKLGLVIGTWSRAVLELGDLADDVHLVDHWVLNRAGDGVAAKLLRHARTRSVAVAAMRRKTYDVAIDGYAYFGNSADLLWSVGAPVRIGFSSGGAGTLYTHRLAFDPRLSIPANQLRLIEPILGEDARARAIASPPPGFRPDPEVERLANGFGAFVVLHVGPGMRHRDWPAAQWMALGRRLLTDGFRLVFTGAPSEAEHVGAVHAALGGENVLGQFGLRGFATLLSRAQGLVAIDTMAGHLAACFQVPTAVVFSGVVPPTLWRPSQPFARIVTHAVPCAPCNRSQGCHAMACIRAVPAQAVYAALRDAMTAKAAT